MNGVYAMDTFFYSTLGDYPFETRCEMLQELGYDAAYLTLWNDQAWDDLKRLPSVKENYGLDVEAVYAVLDITQSPNQPEAAQIITLLERLQGCSRMELALKAGTNGPSPSDPAGDAKAIEWLHRLLPIAERNDIRISLYPHVFFWLERWEDAHRLIHKLRHPLLGLTFSSFHWYAVDGNHLSTALSHCLPYLHAVNICGSRKPSSMSGLPASIECLDQGELDLFALLLALQANGYAGRIGFQGYGIGGDAYANLERNLQVYKRLAARANKHPAWAPVPLRS